MLPWQTLFPICHTHCCIDPLRVGTSRNVQITFLINVQNCGEKPEGASLGLDWYKQLGCKQGSRTHIGCVTSG